MKYMGSKRFMLRNGLGDKIRELGREASYTRFVDLFTGSGAVAHFAAEQLQKPVLATDLQHYATVLAGAITQRDAPVALELLEDEWLTPAVRRLKAHPRYTEAVACSAVQTGPGLPSQVQRAQALCARRVQIGPVWGAYGGHYYSPFQALTFDYLRKYLPPEEPLHTVALAALIVAASRCASAPGHTAQPFKPTESGGPFLVEAWRRDILAAVRSALRELAPRHARVSGKVQTADALVAASSLGPGDLVFVDPPYSSVHYSRFYHVLETIARGECGPVSGVGRYPAAEERPSSKFSVVRYAQAELEVLIETLADTGATVLLTFPEGRCSNGLSGELVDQLARRFYDVEILKKVHGSFSTLGGKKNGEGTRLARQESVELLFVMRPWQGALAVESKKSRLMRLIEPVT